MSKWYGNVGFARDVEYEPGCWENELTVRPYFGDVLSDRWRRQNSGGVNDNIELSKQISIVADPYAMNHCSEIVYVEYMGSKWKVSEVEPQYPRLILSVGGVWNENTIRTTG